MAQPPRGVGPRVGRCRTSATEPDRNRPLLLRQNRSRPTFWCPTPNGSTARRSVPTTSGRSRRPVCWLRPHPRSSGVATRRPAVGREVVEVLSGGSGATWFVCTQHGSPVRTMLRSDNTELRDRLLRPLASGATLAGIALAHLRRPGTPAVIGRTALGGWSVTGHVAWLSSWGLAELVMLGFRDGPDVVFAMVPAREGPGFAAGPLLPLAAMQAARTVSVRLDDYFVRDADVGAASAVRGVARAGRRDDGQRGAGGLRPAATGPGAHAGRGRAAPRARHGRRSPSGSRRTPWRFGRTRTP